METYTTTSSRKQWKAEAGYTITLTWSSRRSRVEVRDDEGQSVLYHEFEWWQLPRAEQEAAALALMAHAVETPVGLPVAA